VIFNPKSCHLRREVITRRLANYRNKIDSYQNKLAKDDSISLEEFQKRFNKFEKKYKLLIAKLTLHESTKASN